MSSTTRVQSLLAKSCDACLVKNYDAYTDRAVPEVEHLVLFKITHSTSVRAFHIICNDLQIWLDIDCGPWNKQEVSAELLCICLLSCLPHTDIAVKDASASGC